MSGERGGRYGRERRDARRARASAGGTSREGKRGKERKRESAVQGGRARGSEQDEGEKERKARGKERRNQISRGNGKERARGRARGDERGRKRERKRASADPAEGARRPHMCSETNVRSECRLLPIIRCRGVPLCARGWSADSVPRFYAARQPGPVRAARLPAKTARPNVSRIVRVHRVRVSNLALARSQPYRRQGRGSARGGRGGGRSFRRATVVRGIGTK